MKLFDPNAEAKDSRYHNSREYWPRIEALYQICHKHLDKKFRSQIKSAFASCYSELYFCATLTKRLNFTVEHPSDEGPDFFIKELSCWAEVTTMSNGERGSPNSIPKPPAPRTVGSYPKEQILLRATSCFSDKAKKIDNDIKKGVINENEPVIICINRGWIEPFHRLRHRIEGDFPEIIKALLPLGDMVFFENLINPEKNYTTTEYKDHIGKIKGDGNIHAIETKFFTDPIYSSISAVIYFDAYVTDCMELGDDFFIVHNPLAKNPLTHGSIKCGIEEYIIVIGDNSIEIKTMLICQKPVDPA